MSNWKNSFFLITGIGISNVGNWIYLIALNLLVIDMTGSPAAVGGLYIIRPLAILVTNTWAGSIIDRLNSRRIMIIVDCIRGILIAVIPFVSSIWAIYLLMFFVNIAASFFGPTSNTYITKLVPEENRKRFNSLFSLSSSGAFLLGPSIAGILKQTSWQRGQKTVLLYVDTDSLTNALRLYKQAGMSPDLQTALYRKVL